MTWIPGFIDLTSSNIESSSFTKSKFQIHILSRVFCDQASFNNRIGQNVDDGNQ